MNRNVAFRRKIIYLSIIAVLLIPLYLIGSPSRRDKQGLRVGGWLAGLRSEYRLSQVSLGEIDPAGESMRLACLGMRGVAANILWAKANYYKMTEQFDNMAATVDQITKLQPNFINVWEFQAHNLSFNTSVEYDDFHFRYHWVKRGLEFLMRGIRYNQDEPRLLWALGWFTEHKIGRSDEYKQFRRLYREDDDFHDVLRAFVRLDDALGPDGRPDCWLTGRLWLLMAQDAVDNKGARVSGRSPVVFHADPSMALMYYAIGIEKEGILGQVGRTAWANAGESWRRYGSREIPTSYGFSIRLNDKEKVDARIDELVAELDKLAIDPDGPERTVREQLRAEKRKTDLSDEERAALDVPLEDRTPEQAARASNAEDKLEVSHERVAGAVSAENRREARRLARLIADLAFRSGVIARYRGIVNFVYWQTRCAAEQTKTATDAREAVADADEYFDKIDLNKAKEKYEEAWVHWAELFEQYPSLLEDVSAEDVVDTIQRYRACLVQLGEPFPDPFILEGLLELHNETRNESARRAAAKAKAYLKRHVEPADSDQPAPKEDPATEDDLPESTEESPEETVEV